MVMNLILNIAYFALSFYVITKSADFFVDEAANVGKKFGMSKLMIGLTIVAVGTSLPEMITSLSSFFFTENASEFVIGTTLGSNITNILLAFGLFLVFSGKFETRKNESFSVYFLIFTTLFFTTFIYLGFVNYIAIILVTLYVLYIVYLAKYHRPEVLSEEEELVDNVHHSVFKSSMILILSFLGLVLGAKIVIYSINNIGEIFRIPTAYLTLSTISIATSLPELAVTVASAKKKEYLIGIGNILGTNIMNVSLIIGLSGIVGYYAVDTVLYISSLFFFLLGTFIFSFMILKKKFYPHIGYLFLFMYVIYLGFLLGPAFA